MWKPTPDRQDVKTYPTPKVADVILRQTLDTLTEGIPAYGTAHPDTTNFPNHVLTYVSCKDENGLVFDFIYAADRSTQEDYNYSVSYPYGGEIRYPRITREYILRRGTYETENVLALGSADPGGPVVTGGNVLTTDGGFVLTTDGGYVLLPNAPDAVLVAQTEEPLPVSDGLGSVYVKVTRIYDVIPGSEDSTSSDGLGQSDNGYSVTRPLGDETFLVLTWKITLPRLIADSYRSSNYRVCPITGYTSLLLVDEKIEASDEQNQTSTITRIYAGNSTGTAFPSTAYVQYQGKFYPGSLPPERFIVSRREVEDTYQTDAPQNQSVSTPSTAPNSPVTLYQGGLIKVEEVPAGDSPALMGAKKVNYYTDLVLQTITGRQWDDNIGNYVNYTMRALPRADADALVAVDGEELTVEPVNAVWSVVTSETPTVGMNGTSFTSEAQISYTTRPYEWPPVLEFLQWGPLPVRPAPGEDPEDSEELYFYPTMRAAYVGMCKAKVTLAYSTTNPLISMVGVPTEQMTTTGLELNWPGVCNLTIQPCLHSAEYGGVPTSFTGTTGTNHPRYGQITYTYDWEPTNYTDWPASIIAEYNVRRYKGGYAIRKVEVLRPNP